MKDDKISPSYRAASKKPKTIDEALGDTDMDEDMKKDKEKV